jgi:hypothetical protein
MPNDSIKMTGTLSIVLTGPDGNVKQKIDTHNLVVSTGKEVVASRLGNGGAAAMSHMALGTSTVEPIAAHTALLAEAGRAAITDTTVTGPSVQYTAVFAPGVGTGAITEAGIFNDVTAGSMLCRTVFPVVNKSAFDTITIVWTVTAN